MVKQQFQGRQKEALLHTVKTYGVKLTVTSLDHGL